MAKHHADTILCRRQPGISTGKLCEKCDGRCVICDSYVRPQVPIRICDECNYGTMEGRCLICSGPGVSGELKMLAASLFILFYFILLNFIFCFCICFEYNPKTIWTWLAHYYLTIFEFEYHLYAMFLMLK